MGEVFAGRYELVDPVGRGGAGAVWRAWDRRRRRYVAAKVLQQSDAHTLLRFVREQALRIDHPHVLAPASWAADDDKVLFTMDLVSGGSLAHLIGDYGPLPPHFVCVLLDQLLAGLAAVHAEGVVHRDIKPANILMEATGSGRPHLRLSDFGISLRKDEPRLTETNYVVGTPGYFAPEQMMGAEPDFPADLFAVGLVALYLLEGSKPDARALVEYFAAHGTPGAPQGVPEPLWQVLAGLLQPNPQNRFRTATGARKALASAVELLPGPDPDEEPVEVFDQIGPLPPGFSERGPERAARPRDERDASGDRTDPAAPSQADPARGVDRVSRVARASQADPVSRMATPGQEIPPDHVIPPGHEDPVGRAHVTGSYGGAMGGPGVQQGPASGQLWTPTAGSAPSPLPPEGASLPAPPPANPSAAPRTGSGATPFPPAPSQPPTPPTQSPLAQNPRSQNSPAPHPPTQASPAQPPPARTPVTRAPVTRAPASSYLPPHYDQTPPTPATTPYTAPYPTAYAAPYPNAVAPPQVPVSGPPLEAPSRHPRTRSRTPARTRTHARAVPRPGPPLKVAAPVLLLALVCFAVGFWALTRI